MYQNVTLSLFQQYFLDNETTSIRLCALQNATLTAAQPIARQPSKQLTIPNNFKHTIYEECKNLHKSPERKIDKTTRHYPQIY